MAHATYFRRQAEVLLSLSTATIDLGIATRLRAMAAEFQVKAEELEHDHFPTFPHRQDGASSRRPTRS